MLLCGSGVVSDRLIEHCQVIQELQSVPIQLLLCCDVDVKSLHGCYGVARSYSDSPCGLGSCI